MNTPRWLRERRRYIKACERYPRRLVIPMPPHELSASDFMADTLWHIPDPPRIGSIVGPVRISRQRRNPR